jgi:NodT family efflux transporter outer membrane factor (OMF) lipoprotein
MLQGCTKLGPDFETPEAPLQEDWLEATEERIRGEPAEINTWWQVFEEPILTELIEIAYKQNLTLQAAGLRVLEARARLGIAIGDQYPQVQDALGSYSYNWGSKNAANEANVDRSFEDLTVGVDSSWEIDFWGKFARSIESSNASLGATIADHDDFLVILTAEVARVYIVVREAEERIRLARENAKLQQRTLEIAQIRARAGAVTDLDVEQARALLAETRSTIPVFEIQRRQAQHALAVLLGIPPSRLVAITGDEGEIPTAPEEVAVGIPAELLRRRPDIRRAELAAAAQSAQIGVARAQLYPAFSLGGFVGFQTSASVDSRSNNANHSDLFKGESFTGFIGPSFSWPFLNYGRLTNNVRVQDARFQALIADYQNTVLEAYREVEDGLVGFLRSREQAGFLSTSVTASRKAVDIALIQYREGVVDYTRVLDTQTDLVARQDSLAVSRSSIAQNLVLTYRGLGGGWQIRGPNDFVAPETIEVMQTRTDWDGILPANDLQDAPDSGAAAAEADTFFRRPDF